MLENVKVNNDLKLSDVIDLKKDVIELTQVDEDTGKTIPTSYILSRKAVEKIKYKLQLNIEYSKINSIGYGIGKDVYSILELKGWIGKVIQMAGVWVGNLGKSWSISYKYPIETLKYRVDARVIITYLGLDRYGVIGESELVLEPKMVEKETTLDNPPKPKKKRGRPKKKKESNLSGL